MRAALLPAAVATFIALSPPAAAQPVTAYTQAASAQYMACKNAGSQPEAQRATACEAVDQSIAQLQSQFSTGSVAEKDYVWFLRGLVQLNIGSAYAKVDGARTQRVCTAGEHAWQSLGYISTTVTYPDAVKTSSDTVLQIVTLCRNEKGTPAWGRPVP